MTGYMFATGFCAGCRQLFTFNPELVPSLTINGRREPFCRACIEAANPRRVEKGLPEIVPLPGAYEPGECI